MSGPGMRISLPGVLGRAADVCGRHRDSEHLAVPLRQLLAHLRDLRGLGPDWHGLFFDIWADEEGGQVREPLDTSMTDLDLARARENRALNEVARLRDERDLILSVCVRERPHPECHPSIKWAIDAGKRTGAGYPTREEAVKSFLESLGAKQ